MVGVSVAIFLILRAFWLWYWKIDKLLESLLHIEEEVLEINSKLKSQNE